MKLPAHFLIIARRSRKARQHDIAEAFGVTRQAVQKWEREGIPEERIIPFVAWVLTGNPNAVNNKKSENPQFTAEGFTEGETNGSTPRS